MSKSILDRNISLNPDAAEDLMQGINSLHCNGQGVFEGAIGLLNTVNGICGEIPSKAVESGLVASIESLIGKLKSYSCMSIGQGITSLIQSLEEKIMKVEEVYATTISEFGKYYTNIYDENDSLMPWAGAGWLFTEGAKQPLSQEQIEELERKKELEKIGYEYVLHEMEKKGALGITDGMPSTIVDLKKQQIREKYAEVLAQYMLNNNPWGVKMYFSDNIPASVKPEIRKQLIGPLSVDVRGNVIVKDDWITLHLVPTVCGEGRSVPRHSNAKVWDWASSESDEGDINVYARNQIEDGGGVVCINYDTVNTRNIFTDQTGRYWVAIGPKVLDDNADLSIELDASDYIYGTMIDIHVQDERGNSFYIPAVVGDLKRHSGPDGYYQTGIDIPTGEFAEGHDDGSTVEFIGHDIQMYETGAGPISYVNRTNNYELIDIIVYEGQVNY